MTSVKFKKIAIVGGGPGGLTLARLLQKQGADVKVYERDEHMGVRVQGATLDLHEESGLAALRMAGLMPEFEANYRPGADKVRLVDKKARMLIDEHEHVLGKYEHSRPEIDRGPLRNILLHSLQPDTIVWNSRFVSMSEVNGSWKLQFATGNTAYADIVIGADGANSKIRPLITPIKPFYAGITAIEGAVYDAEMSAPGINRLLKGGKIFAFGDSKSLIVSSKGDGSLAFYTGCVKDENWADTCNVNFNDKAQALAWFLSEFDGWDAIWSELFENAAYPLIPRPQYCMPLDQTWNALPNLTMLGDAAHLMPPYAGEGVNMAMLDALELSIALNNDEFPDVHVAIAHYERQMRARASATAKDTLVSADALHSPGAIQFMQKLFD